MDSSSGYPEGPRTIVAGILVGGRSRRMGRHKALIDVGGETLLERTVRVALSIASECVLVGEAPFEMPARLNSLQRIPDATRGAGPIAGLAGLMDVFPSNPVLLLACDMPRLSEKLLSLLISEMHATGSLRPGVPASDVGEGATDPAGNPRAFTADAIVPETQSPHRVQPHPCCAIYAPTARDAVTTAIDAGRFEMIGVLDRMRIRKLQLTGELATHLINWNAPIDLLRGNHTGLG